MKLLTGVEEDKKKFQWELGGGMVEQSYYRCNRTMLIQCRSPRGFGIDDLV